MSLNLKQVALENVYRLRDRVNGGFFDGDAGIPKVIDGFISGICFVVFFCLLLNYIKGREKVVVEDAELI